jgi:hypothetical protein
MMALVHKEKKRDLTCASGLSEMLPNHGPFPKKFHRHLQWIMLWLLLTPLLFCISGDSASSVGWFVNCLRLCPPQQHRSHSTVMVSEVVLTHILLPVVAPEPLHPG